MSPRVTRIVKREADRLRCWSHPDNSVSKHEAPDRHTRLATREGPDATERIRCEAAVVSDDVRDVKLNLPHRSSIRRLTTDYQANLPDNTISDPVSSRFAICNISFRRPSHPAAHHVPHVAQPPEIRTSTRILDVMRSPPATSSLELVHGSIPARRAGRRASPLPELRYSAGVQVPSSPTTLREYVPATSPFSSNSMAPDAPS